jgi:HK97 family phage portal protein
MAENRILGIFPRRASKRGLPDPTVTNPATDGALLYQSRHTHVSDEKAMMLSAVYRAVDLISNAVAMLPITLFANGRRIDNDLSYLINHEPNFISTHFQLFKTLTIDILQRGNAFLWIRRGRATGAIEELRYLKPEEVKILYNEETNRKRFVIKHTDQELDAEDIIHFMNYTTDGVVGISVLSKARRSLGISWASEQTAENYFEKGGAVTGVLASKAMLNNKQKEEIRTQWQEVMASEDGGIAIMGADMTFTPITLSASDAQLLETRHFNVEEIARFYGISPPLLGDLTKSSYATFEATSLDFLTNSLQPRLTNIEQELNLKLLSRREKQVQGMHFAFETEDLLSCTKTDMAGYYRDLINNGVMTVNEVRRKLDFEPVAGGDENYIQLNMTTLTGVKNNTENEQEN